MLKPDIYSIEALMKRSATKLVGHALDPIVEFLGCTVKRVVYTTIFQSKPYAITFTILMGVDNGHKSVQIPGSKQLQEW
jgi:hypothetical protein